MGGGWDKALQEPELICLSQITENVTFLFCINHTWPYQITDNTAATDHTWPYQITDNTAATDHTWPYQITDNTAATDHRLICFAFAQVKVF